MKKRLWSIGFAVAASLLACSDDDKGSNPPPGVDAKEVTKAYAQLVAANYAESLAEARVLKKAVADFVATPSQSTLVAARVSWTRARLSYGQTEVYRFYGGPIDGEGGLEGRINSWPLDEAYIDYVVGKEGDKDTILENGIVNDTAPITKAFLAEKNQPGAEETSVSTGWHAIEFLLWGQDLSTTGPGARPYTDYVTGAEGTHKNQDRRRAYLSAVTELLVEDIESVAAQWDLSKPDSYGSKFVAAPADESLTKIIKGIGSLGGAELANERMNTAYNNKDQEEEHSCFSDTTNQDLVANMLSLENAYLGRYDTKFPQVGHFDGPGIEDLVKAKNPALDAEVKQKLAAAKAAVAAIPAPFDQAILNDDQRPKIKAAVDALKDLTASVVKVAEALGLKINLE
ncbi:imelysin family protein [Pendulispora albinea]|uniref:Iron-regulated protein n=1 Tax=Pendulispora albinea TaxID=2741071 RepID=A0ABZ2M5B9_9BACT